MARKNGLLVAIVVASMLGVFAHPAAVSAQDQPGAQQQLEKMHMPGLWTKKRDPIVRLAGTALSLIMRTDNVDDPNYRARRRFVSDAVASRLGVDPKKMDRAWSKAPRNNQIAVLAALGQLGVKYVKGKEDPNLEMDCSGLLWYAWRVSGVDMPRQAVSQLDKRMRVEQGTAVAGSIVGYGVHVQMYLGSDFAMVHAPFNGRKVKLKIITEAQLAIAGWTDPNNIVNYRL